MLDIKLWLEEDSDLDTDHPLYSFKFIQLKAQNGYRLHIHDLSNNKSFISQNLKAVHVGLLGRKFDFFSPSGSEVQSESAYKLSKINLYSVTDLQHYDVTLCMTMF